MFAPQGVLKKFSLLPYTVRKCLRKNTDFGLSLFFYLFFLEFKIIVKDPQVKEISESQKYLSMEVYAEGKNRDQISITVRTLSYDEFKWERPEGFKYYSRKLALPEASAHPCKFKKKKKSFGPNRKTRKQHLVKKKHFNLIKK